MALMWLVSLVSIYQIKYFLLALTEFLILQVLYYADTLAVYKSVYYAGTLLPLALMILGKFVRPPRAAPKAKKES